MPPKKSRKRSAPVAPVADHASPDAAADPASVRIAKRARKSIKAHSHLAEDVLAADAGERAAAMLSLDIAERTFWEQFDTPLLWAWIEDYGIDQFDLDSFDVNQRNKILQTLVRFAEHNLTADDLISITRPKPKRGDSVLKLMQKNFKHRHPKQPMTGLFTARALDGDEEEELDEADVDVDEPPPHPTSTRHASHQSAHAHAAAAAAPHDNVECDKCLHSQPRSIKMQWICNNCNLRGDLRASDPINTRLMAMLNRDEARASSAAPAAAAVHGSRTSSSTAVGGITGQSMTNTPKQLSALDREFERLETSGDAFDLFDDKSPVTPTAAIDEVRKCLRGLNYARPSTSLIKLIQSGKLDKPGYAASENNAKKAQGEADGTHVFSHVDGNLQLAKSVREPLTFASMQQYIDALCAAIIPSLIERPKAILQWLAVTRTMIQIEEKHGWAIAVAYLADLLQDCVPQRRSFSAYSQDLLSGLTYGVTRPPAAAAASSVAASAYERAQSPAFAGNVCRNWNHDRCTTPCPTGREHTCLYQLQNKCDGKHIARNCPRKSSFSSSNRTGLGSHSKSNNLKGASTAGKM